MIARDQYAAGIEFENAAVDRVRERSPRRAVWFEIVLTALGAAAGVAGLLL